MPERSTASTPNRTVVFLATAFTLAVLIFLIDNNLFSQPERFQESDFIMTFYVAGRLVSEGRASELYPEPSAKTFVNSRFDKAAHEYLPTLPKDSTGAYMYIPLVAGFFTPFGRLNPNVALLLWQTISVLALLWCCRELAALTAAKTSEMFFLAFLFLPIFLTLWAGQLGLTFGLLPLCLGFSLLVKNRPLLAGVIWSILLLKPQYFLAAAFVRIDSALEPALSDVHRHELRGHRACDRYQSRIRSGADFTMAAKPPGKRRHVFERPARYSEPAHHRLASQLDDFIPGGATGGVEMAALLRRGDALGRRFLVAR